MTRGYPWIYCILDDWTVGPKMTPLFFKQSAIDRLADWLGFVRGPSNIICFHICFHQKKLNGQLWFLLFETCPKRLFTYCNYPFIHTLTLTCLFDFVCPLIHVMMLHQICHTISKPVQICFILFHLFSVGPLQLGLFSGRVPARWKSWVGRVTSTCEHCGIKNVGRSPCRLRHGGFLNGWSQNQGFQFLVFLNCWTISGYTS